MNHHLRITKIVGGGLGLAFHQDRPWMVSGALPGELVEVEPSHSKRGVQFARALKIISDSHPEREAEPCRHSRVCGGCDWAHVTMDGGAALKADVAAEAARGFSELAEALRHSPVVASEPNSRLRARLHWDREAKRLGFYAPQSWKVSKISGCRVISPALSASLPYLERALAGKNCPPVDVEWLENLDASSAVFALRPSRTGPKILRGEWLPAREEVDRIVGGGHLLDASGVRTDGWGSASVVMNLPIPLTVPIGAFFQGNRPLVRYLHDRIAALIGGEQLPIWDLHAGVGFLAAASLSAGPRDLTAVEVFCPAAEAARTNLPDADVRVGETAESYLAQVSSLASDAVVITDPPRSGLSKALRKQIIEWNPRRIIMLSCDPATWARDSAALTAAGYEIVHLELADLFPSTHHVEVLSALERC